jgi:hypothetical protein
MSINSRHYWAFAATLGACSNQAPDSDGSIAAIAQRLQDPSAILGFETTSAWSTTSGSLAANATHTQGAASLSISNAYYAELQSAALATPAGITDHIGLDVQINRAATSDQVQLYVSIPSRNLYKIFVQGKQLKDLDANSWTTLDFSVPEWLLTELRANYSDLTFTIALISPETERTYLFDNLRFLGGSANSRVELTVSDSNAFIYASVDGIVRRVFSPGDPALGQRLDITSWFGAGSSELRVQALRSGAPTWFHVQAWADGAQILDESCDAPECSSPSAPARIWLDQPRSLNLSGRAKTRLTLVSGVPGKLYVAAPSVSAPQYTGLSVGPGAPVSLDLAPGTYQLGLGTDTPANGAYYEQTVELGASERSIDLSADTVEPVRTVTKIALVPVRHNWVPDASNDGVLTNADIASFEEQLDLARERWFKPFSYGLADWQIELFPTVESIPMVSRPDPDGEGPAGAEVLVDDFTNAYGNLKDTHPITVYFISNHRADGTVIDEAYGSVFAMAGIPDCRVVFTTEYSRGFEGDGIVSPNFFALHELLHCFEGRNDGYFKYYNGLDGLHGADSHGFPNGHGGEIDFLYFYRLYMRGQVAETADMRAGQKYPSLFPTTANTWVGIFPAVRRGYNP